MAFPKRAWLLLLASFVPASCNNPSEPAGVIPAVLELAGGDQQVSGRNSPLPDDVVVYAEDSLGNPQAGVRVQFVVLGGGGGASPANVTTDSLGIARSTWTLGASLGQQLLQARVARPVGPLFVTFTATALALTRVRMSGGPYGIAVNAAGRIYATRLYAESLAVGSLSGRTVGPGIAVGAIPTGVTSNPAGTEAWVTNQDANSVSVVTASTSTVAATIAVPGGPYVIAFTAAGTEAFVSTGSGMVYRINTATRQRTDSVSANGQANGLALHPDGSRLYVSSVSFGAVYEVDLGTFDVTRTFTTGGAAQGLAVSPDGSELYVANQSNRMEVWNLITGTHVTDVILPSGAFGLAMRPDAARIAVGLYQNGRVYVINRTTRTIVDSVVTGGDPRRLVYSADGQTLIVANLSGWIDFVP